MITLRVHGPRWEYVESLGMHGSLHPICVFGGQTIFRNEIVNMSISFAFMWTLKMHNLPMMVTLKMHNLPMMVIYYNSSRYDIVMAGLLLTCYIYCLGLSYLYQPCCSFILLERY